MPIIAEKQMEHIGETRAVEDRVHDLAKIFSNRLEFLWRYDQYIANAEGQPELQEFWRKVKQQDHDVIHRAKELLCNELQRECGKT